MAYKIIVVWWNSAMYTTRTPLSMDVTTNTKFTVPGLQVACRCNPIENLQGVGF